MSAAAILDLAGAGIENAAKQCGKHLRVVIAANHLVYSRQNVGRILNSASDSFEKRLDDGHE